MLLDLVVILFLCLGLIIGWQQGLFKFIKKILPFVGSLIISAFLCKIVAEHVFGTDIGVALNDWVAGLFDKIGEAVNLPVISENGKLFLIGAEGNMPLVDVLKDGGFGIFAGTIESILVKVGTFDGTTTMAQVIVPAIAKIICYVGSYIALFIAFIITISLFNKIWSKILKLRVFRYIDKSLGSVVWAALVVFVMYGLLALLGLFEDEAAIQPFMNYVKESTIVEIMYDNNIFTLLLGEIGKALGLIK
ncbi:MAG: hypothetical protein LBQ27_05180 [Clostridiales bacterium]|jgi:uncharacterized membrane protein required for colicin V production|nr:hypothetical protein [Clostridiales bacterium]